MLHNNLAAALGVEDRVCWGDENVLVNRSSEGACILNRVLYTAEISPEISGV